MAYSIRTRYFLQYNNIDSNQDYINQLYKRNKNWDPPPASNVIETKITCFEKLLKEKHNTLVKKYKYSSLSNLTPLQLKALSLQKKNKEVVIKSTDKNLGPAIMDLDQYTTQILTEHLLTSTYTQLTFYTATYRMDRIKRDLKKLVSDHQGLLPKAEITYFQSSVFLR